MKNSAQLVQTQSEVSLSTAHQLIRFGLSQAKQQSLNLTIAVVDNSGNVVSLSRMDNAALVTIDVALGKAKSAAYLKAPSKLFEDFVNQGKTSMLSTPNILPLQGGVPLVHQGQIVGAVGVSGASGEQDNAIAEAIAQEFQRLADEYSRTMGG